MAGRGREQREEPAEMLAVPALPPRERGGESGLVLGGSTLAWRERQEARSPSRPVSSRNNPPVTGRHFSGAVDIGSSREEGRKSVRPVPVRGDTQPIVPARPEAAPRSPDRRREQPRSQSQERGREQVSPPRETRDSGGRSPTWSREGSVGPTSGAAGWGSPGEQALWQGAGWHNRTGRVQKRLRRPVESILDNLGNPLAGTRSVTEGFAPGGLATGGKGHFAGARPVTEDFTVGGMATAGEAETLIGTPGLVTSSGPGVSLTGEFGLITPAGPGVSVSGPLEFPVGRRRKGESSKKTKKTHPASLETTYTSPRKFPFVNQVFRAQQEARQATGQVGTPEPTVFPSASRWQIAGGTGNWNTAGEPEMKTDPAPPLPPGRQMQDDRTQAVQQEGLEETVPQRPDIFGSNTIPYASDVLVSLLNRGDTRETVAVAPAILPPAETNDANSVDDSPNWEARVAAARRWESVGEALRGERRKASSLSEARKRVQATDYEAELRDAIPQPAGSETRDPISAPVLPTRNLGAVKSQLAADEAARRDAQPGRQDTGMTRQPGDARSRTSDGTEKNALASKRDVKDAPRLPVGRSALVSTRDGSDDIGAGEHIRVKEDIQPPTQANEIPLEVDEYPYRLRSDQTDEFNAEFKKYDIVIGYLLKQFPNASREDIDEAVSEGFFLSTRKWNMFDPSYGPPRITWITTHAYNAYRHILEKQKSRPKQIDDPEQNDIALSFMPAPSVESAREKVAVTRSQNWLRTLFSRDTDMRVALTLLRLESGLTEEAFAKLFGMTRSNFNTYVSQGVDPLSYKLKKILVVCNIDPMSKEGQYFQFKREGIEPMTIDKFATAQDGRKFHYVRTALGDTMARFGERINYSFQWVNNIESGTKIASSSARESLAQLIGLSEATNRLIIGAPSGEELTFTQTEKNEILRGWLLFRENTLHPNSYELTNQERDLLARLRKIDNFRDIVKTLRSEKGVYQKQMAKEAGVHENTIYKAEKRGVIPDDLNIVRIVGYGIHHPITQLVLRFAWEERRRSRR
jgi:transcriptional regulator with XRE-family HTH domain